MKYHPSLLLLSSVMRLSPLLSPLGFLATLDIVNGVHLEIRGKTGISRSKLQRRTSLSGQTTLQDNQNLQYMTNITFKGQPFSVMIDTGRQVTHSADDFGTKNSDTLGFSSDLFVNSQVTGAVDQHYQAGVGYASGNAAGELFLILPDNMKSWLISARLKGKSSQPRWDSLGIRLKPNITVRVVPSPLSYILTNTQYWQTRRRLGNSSRVL